MDWLLLIQDSDTENKLTGGVQTNGTLEREHELPGPTYHFFKRFCSRELLTYLPGLITANTVLRSTG